MTKCLTNLLSTVVNTNSEFENKKLVWDNTQWFMRCCNYYASLISLWSGVRNHKNVAALAENNPLWMVQFLYWHLRDAFPGKSRTIQQLWIKRKDSTDELIFGNKKYNRQRKEQKNFVLSTKFTSKQSYLRTKTLRTILLDHVKPSPNTVTLLWRWFMHMYSNGRERYSDS